MLRPNTNPPILFPEPLDALRLTLNPNDVSILIEIRPLDHRRFLGLAGSVRLHGRKGPEGGRASHSRVATATGMLHVQNMLDLLAEPGNVGGNVLAEPLDSAVELIDLGGAFGADRCGGRISRLHRGRVDAFLLWRAWAAGEWGAEGGDFLFRNGGWCRWSHGHGRREERIPTLWLRCQDWITPLLGVSIQTSGWDYPQGQPGRASSAGSNHLFHRRLLLRASTDYHCRIPTHVHFAGALPDCKRGWNELATLHGIVKFG